MRTTTAENLSAVSLDLVRLDRDHPGFRDPAYRERRNAIARQALEHVPGTPLPRVEYTALEHGTWKTALENLAPLHARYACREFLRAWPQTGFSPDGIAQLRDVSALLTRQTGFALGPVAGLVTPRIFLETLGDSVFLATQYVRHHSAPLYTPEPDVIHELVGHAALLGDLAFARINRLFGEAARRARDDEMDALIRAYWYTLEFGVVREGGSMKVLGAGLFSSFGELQRFETETTLRPFDLAEIARTPFDPTDYQRVLFVAPSMGELLASLTSWLQPIADR